MKYIPQELQKLVHLTRSVRTRFVDRFIDLSIYPVLIFVVD